MSENDTPIEKAVELLVYAPIGLAMFAKDTVPTFMKMFVARGQTEITQRRKSAHSQAGTYKTVGQMAVKYGSPEVKRQAGAAAETLRRRAEETLAGIAAATTPPEPADPIGPTGRATTPPAPTPAPVAATAPVTAGAPVTTNGTNHETNGTTPVTMGELPIPGYDLLSATQVIERLDGLARPELLAVKAYELAHRARTTILGKIAQLAP